MVLKRLVSKGVAAVAVLSLGLAGTSGLASAQSTITLTGPGSTNVVNSTSFNTWFASFLASVGVSNSTGQTAVTGGANVSGNTVGGSAMTGGASNNSGNMNMVTTGSPVVTPIIWTGGGLGDSTISTTGPGSFNSVNGLSVNTVGLISNNNVGVSNNTGQTAVTGGANVSGNTVGGSAMTGSASNNSGNNTSVGVTSGLSGVTVVPVPTTSSATISTTGPGSVNTVNNTGVNTLTVSSTNNVGVGNNTSQGAVTGGANVSGNTVGGSATSGNASNNSGNTTSVSIN